MFNDRDLGVLGAGALLAILCLVLPLPFVGKIVLGLSVLVGFVVLALLRLGPDRIPLEQWLLRRIRFHLQARRYTYQQPGCSQERPWPLSRDRSRKDPEEIGSQTTPTAGTAISHIGERYSPISLTVAEVGVYPLVTVLLTVLGIYFLAWLAQGGAAEIARLIGGCFQ